MKLKWDTIFILRNKVLLFPFFEDKINRLTRFCERHNKQSEEQFITLGATRELYVYKDLSSEFDAFF